MRAWPERSSVNAVGESEWIGVPTVVLSELQSGFRLGGRDGANERELVSFFEHPVVHVFDLEPNREPSTRRAVVQGR